MLDQVFTDVREYFTAAVKVMSALAPADKQLTDREQQFLVECCVLHASGVDVNNFSAVRDHMLGRKIHPRVTDVSQYKNRIAAKGWIKSAHKKLVLPSTLISSTNEGYKFGVTYFIDYDHIQDRPGDTEASEGPMDHTG